MRLAVFCLARPTFDVELAASHAAAALRSLEATGAEMIGDAELLMEGEALERRLEEAAAAAPDAALIVQASFCDAGMAKRIGERLEVPLAVWAFPEARDGGRLRLNSFCGLNLAAHALGRAGRRIGWLHAPPDARPDLEALFGEPSHRAPLRAPAAPAENAAPALADLAGRIGLVGAHPEGFDTCDFAAGDLRDKFDVEVERIDLEELFSRARSADGGRVEALRKETADALTGLGDMEPEPLEKSLRSYAALSDLSAERGLGALAVRCWPETFTDYGCAVCGAMARLSGEGVPAACEADMLGAVAGRLMQALAGGPTMLTDIVDFDAADDSAVLWHCGLAPLEFCDPGFAPAAALHTNRRKPLLHEFPLRPGRVTVARISQALGEMKMVVGRGRMLTRPMSFTGTSGVIRFDAPAGRVRAALIGDALEHHLTIVYGDVKAGLESVAAATGLPVLDLDAL